MRWPLKSDWFRFIDPSKLEPIHTYIEWHQNEINPDQPQWSKRCPKVWNGRQFCMQLSVFEHFRTFWAIYLQLMGNTSSHFFIWNASAYRKTKSDNKWTNLIFWILNNFKYIEKLYLFSFIWDTSVDYWQADGYLSNPYVILSYTIYVLTSVFPGKCRSTAAVLIKNMLWIVLISNFEGWPHAWLQHVYLLFHH